MRALRWVMGLMVAAGALCQAPATTQGGGKADKVELTVVKYDELCDLVRANKGKVILLDFWATTCPPCRKAFPHTVEMHKHYADKGLVVISVSTDILNDPDYPDPRPAALAFLRENNAAFKNVLLDESTDVLKNKLRIRGVPCIYVFNREGQWTQFMGADLKTDEQNRYYQLEQFIQELLKQPAPK